MTLREMVDRGMNEVLGNYMNPNGVKDGGVTLEQEVKWEELTQEMANLMDEITEQNKAKVEIIELPIPYVLTMLDALQAIKKHKLCNLIGDEEEVEWQIDTVIEQFLEPIAMSENIDDIEIALYD